MYWMVLSSALWAEKPKIIVHKSTLGYESILIRPIPFSMGSSTGDMDEEPHDVSISRCDTLSFCIHLTSRLQRVQKHAPLCPPLPPAS